MDLPDFKFIRSDVTAYLYYAGRDRKYMSLSRRDSRIFLELPGFLAGETTFGDDGLIIQGLHRSNATKVWLRDPVSRPRPRSLSSYSKAFPTIDGKVDRSFIADFGNVRAMFVEMKVGDIIVMTPSNHYDNLLIGEVASDWSAHELMTLPEQSDEVLPYRSVNWLSTQLSRRDFPAVLARRMQNRKAITHIDPAYYDMLLKNIYRSYLWGNTSKIDIFAPDYNSNDPTSTAEASFLIKYAIAYYAAFTKGQLDQFNSLDLDVAAEIYFDPVLVDQVAQTFGSPGGYLTKLIGSGAVAVGLILSVALSDEAQPVATAKAHTAHQATLLRIPEQADGSTDIAALANGLTVDNADKLRRQFGRPARAKLGLTLHGHRSPDAAVHDRVRNSE